MLHSLPVFSHFPLYPQSNWALLVLLPGWVGLCMFWGPVGLSSGLSCEAGIFSCHRNPHGFFQSEVLRLYFPTLEPWVAQSVLLPAYQQENIGMPVHQPLPYQAGPLHTAFLSSPLLPVWMNVSSLPSLLLNFHTVQLSGSSGCFLFLNWLLPFFSLCKEVKRIYLCLHVGRKSRIFSERN